MKKVVLSSLAVFVFLMQSAFAQNLGVLSEDERPQKLVPASEFVKVLKSNHFMEPRSGAQAGEARIHSRWWWGWGSYYPTYYYPYYYSYYPYYYGYYWLNQDSDSSPAPTGTRGTQQIMDVKNTPLVCFAMNSYGEWFAEAEVASAVTKTQDSVNSECFESDVDCTQNLGCAIATDES